MARSDEPSLPPAEPRPTGSFGSHPGPPSSRRAPDAPPPNDRPARVQLIVALVLGLSLVAIPLYLWRRPRASDTGTASDAGALAASGGLGSADGGSSGDDGGASGAAVVPTSAALTGAAVGTPVIAECHDRGSKRTVSSACDRLPAVEAAVQQAVTDVGACFPGSAGSTTKPVVATYAIDVSFQRKRNPLRVSLTTDPPSAGTRSQRNACAARVKSKLAAVSLAGVAHEHERYLVTVAGR